MHLRRASILFLLLAIPAAAHGQRAVGEYEPAPRYSTLNIALQLTGDPERGREIMLSWGRMLALGGRGEWMPRLELGGGVSPGTREVVEGVAMGPRLTFARAFPAQFVGIGKESRAEPYLVATAGMYRSGSFDGDSRWGGAPALSGGFGFRVFRDKWNVDLSTIEVVVERRFGVQDGSPQLYLRFGSARAPRDRRDRVPSSGLTGR